MKDARKLSRRPNKRYCLAIAPGLLKTAAGISRFSLVARMDALWSRRVKFDPHYRSHLVGGRPRKLDLEEASGLFEFKLSSTAS